MKGTWVWITSSIVLLILIIISIKNKTFSGWTFFGILFYIALYIAGFLYIKYGWNQMQEAQETDKKKFEYCWSRVNDLLRNMADGQGLAWNSGVGRTSTLRYYHDGTQNKPFRSIVAHLENSQQLAVIIYDIDSDDISDFIANPSSTLINNPFKDFNPFSNGKQVGYDGYDRYSRRGYGFSGVPRKRGGIHINVGQDDDWGGGQDDSRTKPNSSVVDGALNKIKK